MAVATATLWPAARSSRPRWEMGLGGENGGGEHRRSSRGSQRIHSRRRRGRGSVGGSTGSPEIRAAEGRRRQWRRRCRAPEDAWLIWDDADDEAEPSSTTVARGTAGERGGGVRRRRRRSGARGEKSREGGKGRGRVRESQGLRGAPWRRLGGAGEAGGGRGSVGARHAPVRPPGRGGR